LKAVILAGGYGTRISEESSIRPKPMVEIGDRPILWHVMKLFAAEGITEFVICCGYKGHLIKEYFATYALRSGDVTFELAAGTHTYARSEVEQWRVTLADTGERTMTGGRLRRVREYLDDETFFFTYGDSLGDVDLRGLLAFHRRAGALVTLTAVQPPGRFGALVFGEDHERVAAFHEKPRGDGGWVSGGFFVVEPAAIDYVDGDATSWEQDPLARLAAEGELAAFRHDGFWHPMDTLRDKMVLDELWSSGCAPWKTW
jgi:glucose-1-phosphate cytidylyltransferase